MSEYGEKMNLVQIRTFDLKTLRVSIFGKVILNVKEISLKIERVMLLPSIQPFILVSKFVII